MGPRGCCGLFNQRRLFAYRQVFSGFSPDKVKPVVTAEMPTGRVRTVNTQLYCDCFVS